MSLEAVIYQQDPFIYGYKDYDYNYSTGLGGCHGFSHETRPEDNHTNSAENFDISGENWESALPHNTTSSSEVTCGGGATDGFFTGEVVYPPPMTAPGRRKRRRTKSVKNREEMENQRMTHIAVERNRRRQMNDYLAVLRSLMPPSYAQRGDQASIVGGAINFVKELEQLHQFLEAHKLTDPQNHVLKTTTSNNMFSNFFTFPQYSMSSTIDSPNVGADDIAVEKRSDVADIEVAMVESHANIKILSRRRPKQLLEMVSGFQSICLNVLHLNITTIDQSVLYSFSVKVEDECQLTTVNEIATAVHDMMEMIQQEFKSHGGQVAT